jgi:hypothetical protein
LAVILTFLNKKNMKNWHKIISEYIDNVENISKELFYEMLLKGETFASIDKGGNIRVIRDIEEINLIKEKYGKYSD